MHEGRTLQVSHPPSPGSAINVTPRQPRVEEAKEVTISYRPPIDLLIPEQAAHPFRNDGAPLFRSIAARHSD